MKSSDLSIRRLQAGDAPAYRELRLRGLREHPQAFTSSYEEDVEKPLSEAERRLSGGPDRKFWGAFCAGELAGMVGLERETRAKNRHKATVVAMYVAPEWARRGVGLALMQALLADARASRIGNLVLTVTRGNQDAASLYRRLGFQPFGVEPGAIKVDNEFFDKEHMFLQLSAS